ncbi:molybdopterin-dependent oxidoreductase [Massilia sp. METH4]|uniref:molybdopterin-dependent oxidoreductase n=1 Tax=Massilia sp. METH4 TaxID=3123041 RepID=UPI0030D492E3
MEKRTFLGALAATGAAPALAAPKAGTRGPTLLTVTGAIPKANRGRFDPVADQMMFKQKLAFEKAWTFDYAALAALPAVTIKPTLEYDGKVHTLSGPLLADVLKAAGVLVTDATRITLRAVDGYAAAITGAQARKQRFIVATEMDGAPMALGGLGPLWAVYDADRVPEMASRPVAERFGSCPWALYHIDIA